MWSAWPARWLIEVEAVNAGRFLGVSIGGSYVRGKSILGTSARQSYRRARSTGSSSIVGL